MIYLKVYIKDVYLDGATVPAFPPGGSTVVGHFSTGHLSNSSVKNQKSPLCQVISVNIYGVHLNYYAGPRDYVENL